MRYSKDAMKSTWMIYMLWGLGGYIVLSVGFYFLSDYVIYQPPPASKVLLPHSVQIPLPNGKHLMGVYLQNPNARHTILLSHGNAADVARLYSFIEALEWHDFSVLAYDYRGYGHSEGKPSEKNTYEDIQAAFDFLTKRKRIPSDQIILMGMSLGTGPTIELATKVKVAGVILQSPFLTAYRLKTMIPFILFDKYKNIRKAHNVKSPILIIGGTADNIVPPWHTKQLYKAMPDPKQEYWVKDGDHNNLIGVAGEAYFETIQQFADGLK